MRCEEFEEYLSDYIEGETSLEQAERMELHTSQCPACLATTQGVRQVREELGLLAQKGPSASFRLGLWPQVQERLASRQERRWRTVTWGFALGVVLLILLWPEPQDQIETREYASWDTPAHQEYSRRAMSGRNQPLREQFPERAYSGLHAQAQVHLTAF